MDRSAQDGAAHALRVDWEEYYRLIEVLALKIHQSGYEFDSLLCLARGGLRVGDVISRIYERPLGVLTVSSYREGVVQTLRQRFARISELRTAVIWLKGCSQFRPDYFASYLPDSPWIHQPFEVYDRLRPAQLAQRLDQTDQDRR